MSSHFFFSSGFRVIAALSAALWYVPAQAQTSPSGQNPTQTQTPSPAVDQEQFIPYWTTETGWHSELQLRNNSASRQLTVTPALRRPDGAETTLAVVTLKPSEVQSIDLDAAVGSGSPKLIATFGTVVLRYHAPMQHSLYAALMIRNIGHSIAFHIDGTGVISNYEFGSREGIWWLPNESSSDYLVLSNFGDAPMPLELTLFDPSGKPFQQSLSLGPRETSRVSVRSLVRQAGFHGSYGGFRISTTAHAGALDALHIVFNPDTGFSALLKIFDHDPSASMQERDYAHTSQWTLRAPMLALTAPDPALALPEGTTLQPQLFIRNTMEKPLTANLRFNWRDDNTTGKAAGPLLQLLPYETRGIDVAALQDDKTLPKNAHWTSVTLTTNAKPDEILAVAASYDTNLLHGAQTPFSDQLSFAWEGGMWEYDAQHDSLITVGNGGLQPTRAALTLFYNQGTQRYDLEQSLQPDEQMWIDIGKLIREHIPDKNGKVLPLDVSSGSYEFRDLNDNLNGSLFEGKLIYEKTYGHVVYGCMICCGYTPPSLLYSPLPIPLYVGAGNGVDSTDCNDNLTNVSTKFYGGWSTANAAIATVNTQGFHSGVAVGSTNSTAVGSLLMDHGRTCYNTQTSGSGGDNVTPTVYFIGGNNFIFEGTDPTVTVFNGQQVQGNPSGGTFGWSGTSTSSYKPQILFNDSPSTYSTTSGTVTVTVSGALSNSLLDTTLSASYNDANKSALTPAAKAITIRQFEYLVQNGSIQNIAKNGPSQYGFISTVYYNVYTHPQGQVLAPGFSGISVYEQVNLSQCNFPGSNVNTGTGALNSNSEVVDSLNILWSQALPSNLNCAADQYLGVGGFIVRHNTVNWSSSGAAVTNLGPTS